MKNSNIRTVWAALTLALISAGSIEAQAERRFEIHPSIGIARVGDSTSEYYLAPDSSQRDFVPDGAYRIASDSGPGDFVPQGGYRDAEGKIRRMGVRFRIYERDANGEILREITSDEAEIVWRVHLVNKKAAMMDPDSDTLLNPEHPDTMTINPGEREIGPGIQHEVMIGDIGPSAERQVTLGELITDENGRLIVLGGHGMAGSWKASPQPPDTLHNPDWFDDTSDGPVQATIHIAEGNTVRTFEARSAWVVTAPPDYARPVMNLVTLYDLVGDRSGGANVPDTVSFINDVYPILRRVPHLQWTLMSVKAVQWGRTAMHAHGIQGTHRLLEGAHPMHRTRADFFEPKVFEKLHLRDPEDELFAWAQLLRKYVLEKVKVPDGEASDKIGAAYSMPAVGGLTLTRTQYEILSRWSDDRFENDWEEDWDPADPPPEFEPTFDRIALADQPEALLRASLDGGVGGPLVPGIEAGPSMADATIYDGPFHISSSVEPGDLTEGLGVPWQAAFNLAAGELYPGARPVYVIVAEAGDYTTKLWTRPYTDQVPFRTAETEPEDMNEYGMNFEAIYANQRMAKNMDMVRYWKNLGFLARDRTASELMYIETDRTPGF